MINVYKNDTVTIKRRTVDALKNVTYTTTTTGGRIVRDTKYVQGPTGELVASTIQIYLSFTTSIDHGDKVTVDGVDREILQINEKQLFSTNHHKEVFLS